MSRLRVEWLGRVPYAQAHARQKAVLAAVIAGEAPNTLLLCEHDPVFTVGRARGAADNVVAPGDVPVVRVERGGDVTWHGPGQLVGYPICALPEHRHDLHGWLHGLEGVCAATVGQWGIEGGRDPRNTGVWVDGQKIAAIGIACRRWVTWHGFSINVNPDLAYFARIHPCGMDATLVTTMAAHLERTPRLVEVRDAAGAAFRRWWREWSAAAGDRSTG